ncbi:9104_t:CDS:2 [Paraglomus occultum]|uniref:Phosphatidylglycerol/phosphatidylinositol transfer protein n=1 Tax=Paraglomus occultum TaxID=144539 RepID=A0A9N9CT71_9GLOM|nr:9104_t:CDS:2 [Paraglomus occultum]
MTALRSIVFLLILTCVLTNANVIDKSKVLIDEAVSYLSDAFSSSSPIIQAETITDCGRTSDILQIHYIELHPDPPQKGKELTIDAAGFLSETVDKGSYVDVVVKLGLIRLLQKRYDLCDEVTQVGKECPLDGYQTLHHTLDLPKEIPPGRYSVDVNAFTPDHRKIGCLKVMVTFRP